MIPSFYLNHVDILRNFVYSCLLYFRVGYSCRANHTYIRKLRCPGDTLHCVSGHVWRGFKFSSIELSTVRLFVNYSTHFCEDTVDVIKPESRTATSPKIAHHVLPVCAIICVNVEPNLKIDFTEWIFVNTKKITTERHVRFDRQQYLFANTFVTYCQTVWYIQELVINTLFTLLP